MTRGRACGGISVSRFRLALIPLSLALLGIVGATAPHSVSGNAAVNEAVPERIGGLSPAVLDTNPEMLAAETERVKQAPAADAAASHREPPTTATVWLWYSLLSAGILVAMASFLALALWLGRKYRDDLASTRPRQTTRTLAFLESLDGSSQRHAVTGAAYRIGRHSDNDLSIRDASVSRQHAEIILKRSGSFTITDLDSMNGVFVNQKKIDSVILADGDIVEIGDKSFRFRIREHAGQTSVR